MVAESQKNSVACIQFRVACE